MNTRLALELKSFFRIAHSWKLFLAMLAYGCGQGILRPMNAIYLKDHVHLSKLEISTLVSLSLMTDMIVTLSSGLVSDKLQNKRALPLLAALLCIAGLLMYTKATTFWTALLSMILATAPAGVIIGQLFAMARNHFTLEASAIVEIALVWLRAIMSFGFFLGLLVGAQLFSSVSFQGVLIGNIVAYCMVIFPLLIYRERSDITRTPKKEGVQVDWLVICALLLLLCGDAIRGLYFPLMVDSLFHSPPLVSHLWSIQAIFELLWMTVAGYAASRWGALNVIRLGTICAFITYSI